MAMANPLQPLIPQEDFSLREASLNLGGGRVSNDDRLPTAFDLVQQIHYLFIRVVKARDLPEGCNPYTEAKLGLYKGNTKHIDKARNPEWNHVFAFSKDRIQATILEVLVRNKESGNNNAIIGRASFDINEVPRRVPPDSPLAPQWYILESERGTRINGELMMAIWMGTQADEAFPDAWHFDAATVSGEGLESTRSKVYLSPPLWYVRVNVIEAQDLVLGQKDRRPDLYVKSILGQITIRSKMSQSQTENPVWNEDLMFVAAEPFCEPLVLSVEDKLGPNKDECLGKCVITLHSVDKRLDNKLVASRWYNLEKHLVEGGNTKVEKLTSRLHLRVSLDGGYHVFDESFYNSSDHRPTSKALWKHSIGVLELGIIDANGLLPMKTKDGRGTTDAYCVAKYGPKWVRTRTIINSLAPKWNEQYTWEVFDPCTVLTVGVFDNCHLQGNDKVKDCRIGKVRIRLSTLETGKIYKLSYPLVVLQQPGLKKMGELQLAVRFSCISLFNMLYTYSQPMLPKMHYLQPLSVYQIDSLRHQASHTVSMSLNRASPPLRQEVVDYMLDVGSHMWSWRKGRANFNRIINFIRSVFVVWKILDDIRMWKMPYYTIMFYIVFVIVIAIPKIIVTLFFFSLFSIGAWRYWGRPRHPLYMDIKLSFADRVHPDELDEEFDSFPTLKHGDALKIRYDRLRNLAGRLQVVIGDLATQGERIQSLLSWRDPRATMLFVLFCAIATIVIFITPIRFVIWLAVTYGIRPPRFRCQLPAIPINFFKRMPARNDSLL